MLPESTKTGKPGMAAENPYRSPHEPSGAEPSPKLPSQWGKASALLGVCVLGCYASLIGAMQIFRGIDSWPYNLIVLGAVNVAGVIMAIVGLCETNRRRGAAIVGAIVNGLPLVLLTALFSAREFH